MINFSLIFGILIMLISPILSANAFKIVNKLNTPITVTITTSLSSQDVSISANKTSDLIQLGNVDKFHSIVYHDTTNNLWYYIPANDVDKFKLADDRKLFLNILPNNEFSSNLEGNFVSKPKKVGKFGE